MATVISILLSITKKLDKIYLLLLIKYITRQKYPITYYLLKR